MSDDEEGFLSRWSRLKRAPEADDKRHEAAADASEEAAAEASLPETDALASGAAVEAGDESGQGRPALPAIDDITAETDVRAFLQKGVSPDLTRAALRRAWLADPAIRDFIGLAENAYDFNAPDGVPGFSPLQPSRELARIVARIVGGAPAEAELPPVESPENGASIGDPADAKPDPADADRSRQEKDALSHNTGAAAQDLAAKGFSAEIDGDQKSYQEFAVQQPATFQEKPERRLRRGHGGALPE